MSQQQAPDATPLPADVSGPIRFGGSRFSRATLAPDGTIYLDNSRKSMDHGRTAIACDASDPDLMPVLNFHRSFLNAHRHPKNRERFLALDYVIEESTPPTPNTFVTTRWWSDDALETPVRKGAAVFHIPAGNVRFHRGVPPPARRYGLFCNRGIFECPDGALLACCFGNFESDAIAPPAGADIGIKARCFLVRSTDGGASWRYVATIAAPEPDMADNQEGYDEASLAVLEDGRYFAVMRTGHWTPLVGAHSTDQGQTWSRPAPLPGLSNGVSPDLIRLSDGRLALAYGRNVRGERLRRTCELAVSENGQGTEWRVLTVAPATPWTDGRSAYPTIFEVEPCVVFYQADGDCWLITLGPETQTGGGADGSAARDKDTPRA